MLKFQKRRNKYMSFEESLKKLEEIVLSLEGGELTLDKAVELYADGMKVSLNCRKELDSAKLKITMNKPEEDKN